MNLEFWGEHWFLAFMAICCATAVAVSILEVILKSISRFLRVLLVAIRGWPPPHLDADGDWKPWPESVE